MGSQSLERKKCMFTGKTAIVTGAGVGNWKIDCPQPSEKERPYHSGGYQSGIYRKGGQRN